MRIYTVWNDTSQDEGGHSTGFTFYRNKRDALRVKRQNIKENGAFTSEVYPQDIEPTKDGIIEALNRLCS